MLDDSVKYAVIPGFDRYIVGADGSLWSNIIPGQKPEKGFVPWHRVYPSPDSRGYLSVSLSRVRLDRVSIHMHTIVLNAFVGPCPPGLQCRHLNGNEQDCSLGNLSWGTPTENGADKLIHGKHAHGERNGGAKLTADQVKEIRRLRDTGASVKHLVDKFGVGKTTIWRVIKRTHWTRVD